MQPIPDLKDSSKGKEKEAPVDASAGKKRFLELTYDETPPDRPDDRKRFSNNASSYPIAPTQSYTCYHRSPDLTYQDTDLAFAGRTNTCPEIHEMHPLPSIDACGVDNLMWMRLGRDAAPRPTQAWAGFPPGRPVDAAHVQWSLFARALDIQEISDPDQNMVLKVPGSITPHPVHTAFNMYQTLNFVTRLLYQQPHLLCQNPPAIIVACTSAQFREAAATQWENSVLRALEPSSAPLNETQASKEPQATAAPPTGKKQFADLACEEAPPNGLGDRKRVRTEEESVTEPPSLSQYRRVKNPDSWPGSWEAQLRFFGGNLVPCPPYDHESPSATSSTSQRAIAELLGAPASKTQTDKETDPERATRVTAPVQLATGHDSSQTRTAGLDWTISDTGAGQTLLNASGSPASSTTLQLASPEPLPSSVPPSLYALPAPKQKWHGRDLDRLWTMAGRQFRVSEQSLHAFLFLGPFEMMLFPGEDSINLIDSTQSQVLMHKALDPRFEITTRVQHRYCVGVRIAFRSESDMAVALCRVIFGKFFLVLVSWLTEGYQSAGQSLGEFMSSHKAVEAFKASTEEAQRLLLEFIKTSRELK